MHGMLSNLRMSIQNLIWDEMHGLLQGRHSSFWRPGALTERALPQPGSTLIGEEAQQVAHNAVRWRPLAIQRSR